MKKLFIILLLAFIITFSACNKNTVIEDKYNVNVTYNYNDSVSLIGGASHQIVSKSKQFKEIKIKEKPGYRYLYHEIDGIKYYDEIIKLEDVSKDTNINIVTEYSLDDLPIIEIKTEGAVYNKYNYVNMTFSMTNVEEELKDIVGQIKLRGNTTATLSKKPYAIKFDKKQSLFGLEKAKSWVLLADYLDPSTMHNWCALTLGNKFDNLEFTPTPNKVNLYLNDKFQGIYTLCEKVQENKGRLNIEEDLKGKEYTDLFDYNFLIEMEDSVKYELDAIRDETYFYLEEYGKYIEVKYPEKSAFDNEEDYFKFFNDLKEYITLIFDKAYNNDIDYLSDKLNYDSLIDYLLVDLTMGETDHRFKSFYIYYKKDNQKLNFGPIWDYDFTLYVPWTYRPNKYYKISDELKYMNAFFELIKNNDIYYNALKNRYETVGKNNILEMINDLKNYYVSIEKSLETNAIKWYNGTKIYEDNMEFLINFLENRIRVFDEEFLIN